MAYTQHCNPFKQTIKRGRKRHARSIRKHAHHVEGEKPGSESTHLMGTYEGDNKYYVAPTITTDEHGYEDQDFQQALDAGEVYEFKNKNKAEKFAHGSWKRGKDRRDAMKEYRQSKRNR